MGQKTTGMWLTSGWRRMDDDQSVEKKVVA